MHPCNRSVLHGAGIHAGTSKSRGKGRNKRDERELSARLAYSMWRENHASGSFGIPAGPNHRTLDLPPRPH